MEESILKLNQYLEQMLGCMEPINMGRFGELNREYTPLMNETFVDKNEIRRSYDTMRNRIGQFLMYPDSSIFEFVTSEIREFLNQAQD